MEISHETDVYNNVIGILHIIWTKKNRKTVYIINIP